MADNMKGIKDMTQLIILLLVMVSKTLEEESSTMHEKQDAVVERLMQYLGVHDCNVSADVISSANLDQMKIALIGVSDSEWLQSEGRTLLDRAIIEGNVPVVHALLMKGVRSDVETRPYADSNRKWGPLVLAAEHGNLHVVLALLAGGVSVEPWISRRPNDPGYKTALLVSSRKGDAAIVEVLLAAGANIHDADEFRNTPLHLAAKGGHEDATVALLNAGANTEARAQGRTPLHMAAQNGHTGVIALLLMWGANPNAQGNGGEKPLARAQSIAARRVITKNLESGMRQIH